MTPQLPLVHDADPAAEFDRRQTTSPRKPTETLEARRRVGSPLTPEQLRQVSGGCSGSSCPRRGW